MQAMTKANHDGEPHAQDLRHEIKFVAYDTECRRMMHWLKLNPAGFYSQYPDRIVNNIYFDTMELSAYVENLTGIASRSKVRYRWYGDASSPSAGTLEIKRKRNQFGWKIRYPIEQAPYAPGDDWRQVRAALMDQLPAEGRHWLHQASLPVLINRYRRQYFVSADRSIRATIDTDNTIWDQRSRRRPDFEGPGRRCAILIVEFKFGIESRTVASDMLVGIPIRVSRCSKYMSGVGWFDS